MVLFLCLFCVEIGWMLWLIVFGCGEGGFEVVLMVVYLFMGIVLVDRFILVKVLLFREEGLMMSDFVCLCDDY